MSSHEHKYVPGHGPFGAKLMILGECPTPKDTVAGRAFTDSKELQQLLTDAGIRRDNCWQTYVSKFEIPPNVGKKRIPFPVRAKAHGVDLDKQLEELQEEINGVQPNCILALGKTPLCLVS